MNRQQAFKTMQQRLDNITNCAGAGSSPVQMIQRMRHPSPQGWLASPAAVGNITAAAPSKRAARLRQISSDIALQSQTFRQLARRAKINEARLQAFILASLNNDRLDLTDDEMAALEMILGIDNERASKAAAARQQHVEARRSRKKR